ncbi:uncharacterized protein LOC142973433 [Anticarsia gemmatalis]|uniref:uncharacterized protein LOC142973433 n=1 Tax=Anticarsia gemmatalis TaxID=129554 RepID=UPI003F76022A
MEVTYKPSRTTKFFYKLNYFIYMFGIPSFWIEDLNISKTFVKIYNKFSSFNNVLQYIMILSELAAFFTQFNLTERQRMNLYLFAISHPILCFYHLTLTYHRKRVRSILYTLTVSLKRDYNDEEVESHMISKTKTYLTALLSACMLSMVMYICDACSDMMTNDVTFTTLITAYPDVQDRSVQADVFRALINIIWWIFMTRIYAVFLLVIPLSICLSHQYINLQSYFRSLNDIFDRNDLSQSEKEDLYESKMKAGIKFHSETLECTRETQTVCNEVFSGQIIFNIVLVVVLMAQMVKSERNLSNLCATSITASAVLISTGFFMWNAGDVTVEASHLATSIYFSGWQNCQNESSTRIRNLVSITMAHAQKPVILKGLGYIKLSYASYLRIVKSSYSVFSVLF